MVELSRRERKKQETREKLFAAAMYLFRTRGYESTSVEQITENADVGKGTFYNYFPSKEAVVLEFARQAYQDLMKAGREKPSASARERLRGLLHDWAKFMTRDREIAWIAVRNREGPVCDAGLHYGLKAVLTVAQRSGEISPEFDADFLAESLEGAMLQHFISWYVTGEGDLEAEMDGILAVFFEGLAAERRKA